MATPTSATSQAPSYKTNVNRAKTKRWVEAKSYSYDGDDWGDVDDYDEYPGYDEPEPLAKPTGLRQRGQSLSKAAQPGDRDFDSGLYQSPTSIEGPAFPHNAPRSQYPAAPRHVTNPPTRGPFNSLQHGSSDSAENRRAFSAGPVHRNADEVVQAPTHHFQNIQTHDFRPSQQPPGNQPTPKSVAGQPVDDSPWRQNLGGQFSSTLSEQGPENQRHLPPQDRWTTSTSNTSIPDSTFEQRETRAPTMLSSLSNDKSTSPQHDSHFTPRKSSLGQQSQPPLPFDHQPPPPNPIGSNSRERAGSSSSARSAPFVRPADIYKRIEAERERERQSLDTARPAIDELVKDPAENPQSEHKAGPDMGQRSNTVLEPVTERKSEYDRESLGMYANSSTEHRDDREKRRTTSKTFDMPNSGASSAAHSAAMSPSLRLPDPTRISGFGQGFGESFMKSAGSEQTPSRLEPSHRASIPAKKTLPIQTSAQTDLQHTPSKGFTSVVHQAFDTAQEQVPPTPSSTADSSIARSSSGGTNAISPIMSRGPSAVDRDRSTELPTIDDITTPTQNENNQQFTMRQRSRSPSRAVAQTIESGADREAYNEAPPPGFKMGHRRSSSTPSPDNSPAKTPMLASMSRLRHAEEVDIAQTTPTPTDSVPSAPNSVQESPPPSPSEPTRGKMPDSVRREPGPSQSTVHESSVRPESAQSNTTPRASLIEAKSPNHSSQASFRPGAERLESFRPQLPGGWQSSSSIQPLGGSATTPKLSSAAQRVDPQAQKIGINAKLDSNNRDSPLSSSSGPSVVSTSLPGIDNALAGKDKANFGRAAGRPGTVPSHDVDEGDAPTPLPKDTPKPLQTKSASSGYFPASNSRRSSGDTEQEPNARQPSSLPPLSTNMQQGEYESDRLRREIVRELSPGMRSDPTTATSDSSHQPSTRYPTNESTLSRGQSSGLPSEYDSYWNDDSEDGDSGLAAPGVPPGDATVTPSMSQSAMTNDSRNETLIPRRESNNEAQVPAPDKTLKHRFSWEQPLADISEGPQAAQQASKTNQEEIVGSALDIETPKNPMQSRTAVDHRQSGQYSVEESRKMPIEHDMTVNNDIPELDSGFPTNSRSQEERFTDGETNDSATVLDDKEIGSRGDANLSSRDADIHGPRNQSHSSEPVVEGNIGNAGTQLHTGEVPPAPPTAGTIPKLPAFREILSLKSPQDRIRAFSDTQHEFAKMNTGLAHWLAMTVNSLPEHSDLTNSNLVGALPADHKPISSTSRQQTSASNVQSTQPGASPGNAGPGSQVNSGSGKISTHQVQVKGKEFLHSAGVFSGKANVAAKGLFSKGKSKLRDASGSKKAFVPLPHTSRPWPSRGMQAERAVTQPHTSNKRSSLQRQEAESEQEAPSIQSLNQSQLADDECSTESDRLPRSSRIFRKRDSYEATKFRSQEPSDLSSSEPGGTLSKQPRHEKTNAQRQSFQTKEGSTKPANLPKNLTSQHAPSPPYSAQSQRSSETAVDSATHHGRYDDHMSSRLPSLHDSLAVRQPNSSGSAPADGQLPIQTQDTQSRSSQILDSRYISSNKDRGESPPRSLSSRTPTRPGEDSLEAFGASNRDRRGPQLPLHLEPSLDEERSTRRVSNDADSNLKPSPVSPSLPIQTTDPPRGRRIVPVHHGVEHNFMPPTTVEQERRRSQSFSRPFSTPQNRSRSGSPRSQRESARRPSAEEVAMPIGFYPQDLQQEDRLQARKHSKGSPVQHQPAQRRSAEEVAISANFYPQNLTREETLLPRQQAPEYALEGVGPPEFPPKDTKSQSRRGSRGSAFFKSLTKPFTDSDNRSGSPSALERFEDSPAASSSNLDGRSKRSSIFGMRRSRTELTPETTKERGNGPSKPSLKSRESSITTNTPAPLPPSKSVTEDDEFPMRPKQRTSSGFSKKFQRSTTSASGNVADSGKKNRFSAIGSLFAKHSSRRKSSLDHLKGQSSKHSRTESQTLPPTLEGSNDHHHNAAPQQPQYGYYTPRSRRSNQDPLDGYYSPRRERSPLRNRSRQDSAPQSAPDIRPGDAPAYVQDSSSRQHTSPHSFSRGSKGSRTSIDFFRKMSRGASPTSSESQRYAGQSGWNRFSRPNSPKGAGPPPVPHGGYGAHQSIDPSPAPPTVPPPGFQGSDIQRSDSPPPPPPPPKDGWHVASPRRSSLATASIGNNQPSDDASLLAQNSSHSRQFSGLPPLQTDFAPIGPIKSGMTSPPMDTPARPMTYEEKRRSRQLEIEAGSFSPGRGTMSPQEKRRSRQWEIETSHLSPVRGKPSSPPGRPTGIRKVKEVEEREGHDARMSATSFPGQEWAPEHQYAWLGDA